MCWLPITILKTWMMLVLNLPFKALMFLTLMRPSLVLFLVLWLKLIKDFLKVRCRRTLLPFLISCLIWLDLVARLPLIKERILVIILMLRFLGLMFGCFFQAKDGIRVLTVTGVQTCALPILGLGRSHHNIQIRANAVDDAAGFGQAHGHFALRLRAGGDCVHGEQQQLGAALHLRFNGV